MAPVPASRPGRAPAAPARHGRLRAAAAARGVPLATILFALGHSLTAGIVTAAAFIACQQIENHVPNPVVMSRTVEVNPLLVLLSLLAFDIARTNDKRVTPPFSAARLSGGLVGEQQFADRQ
jgi:hypothetical protein